MMLAGLIGAVTLGFAAGWSLEDGARVTGTKRAASSGFAAVIDSSGSGAFPASFELKRETSGGDFTSRLDHLATLANPLKRTRAIARIADDLNATQVREALAALENKNLNCRDEIRLQLIGRWAELEPEAALQYALELPHGSLAPEAINVVITTWAATDGRAAEARVEAMTESFAKRIAWAALAEAISATDPKRAFTLMRRGTPSAEAIEVLFERWTKNDPYEAAAGLELLGHRYQRDVALRAVSRKFAEADRERALEWAQALPASERSGESIAIRDPARLATVVETWMNEDPGAALNWLRQLPDDFAKSDVLTALTRSLSDDDPGPALEVAAMMPAGKARDSALTKVINNWGEKDFTGALAWAQQLQETALRQNLLSRLAGQLAGQDIPAALELASSIGDKPGQQAVNSVLDAWTRKEPAAAAAWAVAQLENESYLATVGFMWAGKDEKAAREWVLALAPGTAKDQLVLGGVRNIAQSSQPLRAEPWIVEISDPSKQAEAYGELAFWWLRSNPKAARAWINNAPLSPKVKRELLNPN
jgi:hypothetical protein